MRRHELDRLSLVTGVAFVALGLLVLMEEAVELSARWALPVLLIAVGVTGLLASRPVAERRDRGPRRARDERGAA